MAFKMLSGFIVMALLAPPVLAGDAPVIPSERPKETKIAEGWDFLLTPGLIISISDNHSVLGQTDGLNATMGVVLAAGVDYREGTQEVRNRLNFALTYSRTPVIDEFLKTADSLKEESIYLFHLLEWLGPYFQFNLDTAILESFAIEPSPVNWIRKDSDGNVVETIYQRTHFRLTDGFQPLFIKETAGFFADAYKDPDKAVNVEFRLGFGGQHVIADGQRAIKDASNPAAGIEFIDLASFNQAGIEVGGAVWGEMYEKRLTYKASVTAFTPVVFSLPAGDNRGTFDLINVDISAIASFKLLEWLSLDYQLKVEHQPQLLDSWQVQNNLLLTASYAFFKPEKEKKD